MFISVSCISTNNSNLLDVNRLILILIDVWHVLLLWDNIHNGNETDSSYISSSIKCKVIGIFQIYLLLALYTMLSELSSHYHHMSLKHIFTCNGHQPTKILTDTHNPDVRRNWLCNSFRICPLSRISFLLDISPHRRLLGNPSCHHKRAFYSHN